MGILLLERDRLAFAMFWQDYIWDTDIVDDLASFKEAFEMWKRQVRYFKENPEHFGDCTNEPQTCIKCYIEHWYEKVDKILEA